MKKKGAVVVTLLAVGLVALLGGASQASAHNRVNWYWNAYSAQQSLLDDGIEWADGYEYVEYAR